MKDGLIALSMAAALAGSFGFAMRGSREAKEKASPSPRQRAAAKQKKERRKSARNSRKRNRS